MSFWTAIAGYVLPWAAEQFIGGGEDDTPQGARPPKPTPGGLVAPRKTPGLDVSPFSYDQPSPANRGGQVVDNTRALTSVGPNDPIAVSKYIHGLFDNAKVG